MGCICVRGNINTNRDKRIGIYYVPEDHHDVFLFLALPFHRLQGLEEGMHPWEII